MTKSNLDDPAWDVTQTWGRTYLAYRGVWQPGMLAMLDGLRGDYRVRIGRIEGRVFYPVDTTLPYALDSYVPDFTDDATRGVAMGEARRRWDHTQTITWRPELRDGTLVWCAYNGARLVDGYGCAIEGPTEIDAILGTLRATP